MRLKIKHITEYHYSEPQRMIVQSHRLYPTDCAAQKIINWAVDCEEATFGNYFFDGAGDRLRTMSINQRVSSITIATTGEVTTNGSNGVIENKRDFILPTVYLRSTDQTKANPDLLQAADESVRSAGENNLDKAHAITQFINQRIQYDPKATNSGDSAASAFAAGRGVCQDQTHCALVLARVNQIPARYVVGYLFTDADGQQHDASHAWAELYIDGLGWVGFDATNNCCPDERYVRLGSGLDALDAAPIRGISRGIGAESMATSVKITEMQQ